MAKKRRATLRDVWHTFLVHESDPEGALAELKRLGPSRNVIKKAVADLQVAGKTNTVLQDFIAHCGWSFEPPSRRPKANDTRVYAVLNQSAGGGPFVRIPVSALGIAVGDHVRANFLIGKITLEPMRAAA